MKGLSKFIGIEKVEQQLSGAGCWGGVGQREVNKELVFNEYRVSVCNDENFQRVFVVNVPNATELYIKIYTIPNFKLCIFYHNKNYF